VNGVSNSLVTIQLLEGKNQMDCSFFKSNVLNILLITDNFVYLLNFRLTYEFPPTPILKDNQAGSQVSCQLGDVKNPGWMLNFFVSLTNSNSLCCLSVYVFSSASR
jgi:hypothetical protein